MSNGGAFMAHIIEIIWKDTDDQRLDAIQTGGTTLTILVNGTAIVGPEEYYPHKKLRKALNTAIDALEDAEDEFENRKGQDAAV
jgi:hypothetical protein